MRSSIFTRPPGCLLALLGLALSLLVTACGSDPTPTPVPGTIAVFTSATNITLGDTTTVGPTPTNSPPAPTPSLPNFTDSGAATVPPAVTVGPPTEASFSVPTPKATATTGPLPTSVIATVTATPVPPLTLPIYDGFKPVNLGSLTTQLVQQFGQAGPSVGIVGYATSDNFSKLAAFYNRELPKLGYGQSQARDLPQGTPLNGKILLYSKGSGTTLDGLIIIGFGPLDRPTLNGFATDAPEVAVLKDGDSLILVISGLNGAYLSSLQKTFTSGGLDTPTPGR